MSTGPELDEPAGPQDETVEQNASQTAPGSPEETSIEPSDGERPVEAGPVGEVEARTKQEVPESAVLGAHEPEPTDDPDDRRGAGTTQSIEPTEPPETAEHREAPEPPEPRAPEGDELRGAIEAILLVVDEPVTATVLAQVVAVPEAVVLEVLDQIRHEYDEHTRGFELREIGAGWRLYTRPEYAAYVERFVLDGQQARLTQAALETLAVVAYRQPVSRSRVSAVRGVNVDGVMRTLVSRGLVEEAGTENETGAVLYRTTAYFLERLGLRELTELPTLANFLPESTTIDELESQLSTEGRDV